MELMFDTANLKEIEQYSLIFPIVGVTSNPSILKKEGKIGLFEHFKQLRRIIGNEKSLHIQVTQTESEKIVEEAYRMTEVLGKETYIKIPVNVEGLKAIQILKKDRFNITATAIYTMCQGDYAIMAGADYIAPYYNRMENININPNNVIQHFSKLISKYNKKTKIIAASFKNIGQVMSAYESGAQIATVDPKVLIDSLNMPSIESAVQAFKMDWENTYGKNISFLDL